MPSRFTALPLAIGEAFVLETDHNGKRWVILYDGGQNTGIGPKNEQYALIREHCPEIGKRIDIAVCSHSDRDHSGGFPDLIETWVSEGGEIGEFWLPAQWSPALPELLTNPDQVVSRLIEGATTQASRIIASESNGALDKTVAADSERSRYRSIEQMIYDDAMPGLRDRRIVRTVDRRQPTAIAETSRSRETARSLGLDPVTFEVVRRNLEDAAHLRRPLTELHAQQPGNDWIIYDETRAPYELGRSLASSVIETAEAIRRIADTAATYNITVRWFDFTPFERQEAPSGGELGFFQPLNTVEVEKVERETNSLKLFFSLKLTEQNVSSLVFQRVPTASEPSVIFVADSRLAFGIDRPEDNFPKHLSAPAAPVIYTAAHHGSRNNDRAYDVLKEWLGTEFDGSIAVRNGGVHNQTLENYLDVERRRCAQCYQCHGGDWGQLVQLTSDGPSWAWPPEDGKKCGTPKSKKP